MVRLPSFPRLSRCHLYLTWVWVAFAIPTVLWWKDSILWVSLASIYANIVTHWGAYTAARAEEEAHKTKQMMMEQKGQTSQDSTHPRHYPWTDNPGD